MPKHIRIANRTIARLPNSPSNDCWSSESAAATAQTPYNVSAVLRTELRQRYRHHRSRQPNKRRNLLAPDHPKAAKQKTDRQAAAIAEENGCRVKVKAQEC